MKVGIGFSLLFRNVLESEVKIEEFDALFFECKREDFFRVDGLIPKEVTRHCDDRPTADVLDAYYEFMSKVRQLDAQGRVHFRRQEVLGITRHQPFLALLHKQGHEVWFNGEWYKPTSKYQKDSVDRSVEAAKALAEGRHAKAYADFFEEYGTPVED